MNMQELVNKRIDLSLKSEVVDEQAYALEWAKLAADFRTFGALANAELCDSNAKRYGGVDSPVLIQQHIAEAVKRGELTPAEAEQTEAELMKG